MRTTFILVALSTLFFSCKSNTKTADAKKTNAVKSTASSTAESALNQAPDVTNIPFLEDQQDYTLTPLVQELTNPWGMTWLPNNDLIITEKEGIMYRFDGVTKHDITGVPEVYTRGQGGLLDVTVHPNFKENNLIYISYASPAGEESGGNTAIAKAVLKDDVLTNLKVLYKASPNTKSGIHYGSRFAWDKAGYLYFTMGERGERDENPQDVTRDNGKIYRIHDDGRIPADNPFVNTAGAKTAIYSYGHRNPQGMLVHPKTGLLIAHEHGPQGGDEINIIKPGLNYGWPVISYGEEYGGGVFAESTQKAGMEQPIYYWTPSIAPCGFTVIDNPAYKEWNGNYLVGSLKFQYLEMLTLTKNSVTKREKIADKIGRLRNVKMSPDGIIHISVEGKGIFTITRN